MGWPNGWKRRGFAVAARVFAGPLGLLALLAGCSSGEAPQDTNGVEPAAETAAAALDPCTLVTMQEVAAIIGEPVVRAVADDGVCKYETQDAMASSVEIEVKRPGGTEEMKVAKQAAGVLGNIGQGMAGSGGAAGDAGNAIAESSAAPGLGDEAFFGPNQQLHVLKGDSYIAVSPPMMRSRMASGNPMLTPEAKRQLATEIVTRALAKL